MYGRSHVQTAQDIHYSVGECGLKLMAVAVIFLGVVALGAYFGDSQASSKSATWPTVEGNLVEIGSQGLPLPIIGRYLPLTAPYAKYTYSVVQKNYTGEKKCVPTLSYVRALIWQAPKPLTPDTDDIVRQMKEDQQSAISSVQQDNPEYLRIKMQQRMKQTEDLFAHPKYKPVLVRYDPLSPDVSVLDPEVLQSQKSQVFTGVILIALGGLVFGAYYTYNYLTAPEPDDPALSLEAALAQRRKRK